VQILCRFLGQRPRLADLERLPISPGVGEGPRPGDARDRSGRVVAREAPGPPEPDGPYRRLARALRAYEVFPPRLVTGVLRRPVEPGDTFGTCYHFLPGVDLFFGGRVTECFDGPAGGVWRSGWAFRTLAGHPMVGEEAFAVEKDPASGAVRVEVRSWSRPASWPARVTRPLNRRLQVRAVRAALDHLADVASGSQPGCAAPPGLSFSPPSGP
jgi:hypothetical protein